MSLESIKNEYNNLLESGLSLSEIAFVLSARNAIVQETELEQRIITALEALKMCPFKEEMGFEYIYAAFYLPEKNILQRKETATPIFKKFAAYPPEKHKIFPDKIEPSEIKNINNFLVQINNSGIVLFDTGKINNKGKKFLEVYTQQNLTTTVKNALKYETDPLTGILKREPFIAKLEKIIDRAKDSGEGLSILMIDLDNFKEYNDTLGHLEGNHLLSEFANVLKQSVRESDIVGRFGGDEFIVLFNRIDLQDTRRRTESLSKIINSYHFLNQDKIPSKKITASIGVSHFPTHALSQEELINKADKALYSVKKQNKGNFCVYNRDLENEL